MKRIIAIILIIKNNIIFLYNILFNSSTSIKIKVIIIWMILYIVSPIDIINDVFPILGQIDDIAIILFVTNWIKLQNNTPLSKNNKKRIIREVTYIK
jgi:uncharacterized membrane protein YkvA (DUF1232 family)